MDPELVPMLEAARRLGAVDYKRLEVRRSEMWRGLAAILQRYDALLCPTMAIPAPDATMRDDDFLDSAPDGRLKGMDMTCLFNLVACCPVISVPSGFAADGLPTACQIVARPYDEPTLLEIARAVEIARPWADRRPPI
jgi:Asp-tRNA(Asn)/Glu-tRNA(Gln) amidotransferase A subunit family amidase